jgi:Spy/CpxP family protein refolding chaperone
MNNKTKIIKAALVFMALTVTALAWAGNPAPGKGQIKEEAKGEDKGPAGRLASELNLTDAQRQKLQEGRQGRREKMQKLREAVKQKRQELKAALQNPSATRAAIEPVVAQLKALQGQLIDARVDHILTLKEILTPEQFAKMQARMKEHLQNRKQDKQGRSGGFQGKEGHGGVNRQKSNGSGEGRGPMDEEGL